MKRITGRLAEKAGKKIQGWLGHSTIAITADTYAHLDAHSKRGSASVIENALAITA